jgi:hypothetical protein
MPPPVHIEGDNMRYDIEGDCVLLYRVHHRRDIYHD